tara:strand:- start:5028 stop:5789 length:762 start_codon:yes stop_codon:yes gene_type:complete
MNKTVFSVIVISKDNSEELFDTIKTIPRSDDFLIELIVVDSSEKATKIDFECHNFIYKHTKPNGIYKATNLGISLSKGDYIIVMNSGDGFHHSADILFDKIIGLKMYDAFVFSVIYRKQTGDPILTYTPNSNSLWPEQTVVLTKSVYDKFGYFPEKYSYAADQIYYAEVRSSLNIYYNKEVLGYFTHGGVSTNSINFRMYFENFTVWRKLHRSLVFSFLKAFLFPFCKYFLENTLGLNGLGVRARKLLDSNIS